VSRTDLAGSLLRNGLGHDVWMELCYRIHSPGTQAESRQEFLDETAGLRKELHGERLKISYLCQRIDWLQGEPLLPDGLESPEHGRPLQREYCISHYIHGP
jgi:hypothetical protein